MSESESAKDFAYPPYDQPDDTPGEFRRLIEKVQEGKMQILVWYDANTHHVIWGSAGTNKRGKSSLVYWIANRLDIVNMENEPIFNDISRRKVIDLTIGTVLSCSGVTNCYESEKTTLPYKT